METKKKDNMALAEEVRNNILSQLVTVEPGSEEAKALLNDLDDISKTIDEMEKETIEDKKISHDDENKKKERRQGIWLAIVGFGIQIGGIVVGLMTRREDNKFAERLADKSIEFEKTGNWTSSTGKGVSETFKNVFRKR